MTIPPGATIDEGARVFWRAIASAYPDVAKNMAESSRDVAINEIRAQLDRIEAALAQPYRNLPASPSGLIIPTTSQPLQK